MPTLQDLNDFDGIYSVQSQNQFSKLSVYFALNQVQYIPMKEVFGMLYADKPWQANMGPTMQGVRIEPTPKIRTFFRPNAITARANKDVFDQRENQERASVFWHKFESPLIYFLRNWQDFIADQIRPAMSDMNDQIVFSNERFIETVMWDRAPAVYTAGDTVNGPLIVAPDSGPPAYTATPKSAAWLSGQLNNVKSGLTLAVVDNAFLTLREEQGAAPFDGAKNALPKDNALVQGKYALLTSSEAFSQIKWDPAWTRFRDVNEDYIGSTFMGEIFGQVVVKGLQKPFRFDATGVAIAPEILIEATGETIPNPNYSKVDSAPFELAWMLGSDAYHTVKIGPPPKEFSGGASAKQVNGMVWNGKVNITDRVLLRSTDTAGNTVYEYNSYGEYLRLQATLTMGCLPGRPRNALPILFRRARVSEAP
jgi:hypothetical protein